MFAREDVELILEDRVLTDGAFLARVHHNVLRALHSLRLQQERYLVTLILNLLLLIVDVVDFVRYTPS